MPNKYAEVTPRNFNPMWAPGLSDEARAGYQHMASGAHFGKIVIRVA